MLLDVLRAFAERRLVHDTAAVFSSRGVARFIAAEMSLALTWAPRAASGTGKAEPRKGSAVARGAAAKDASTKDLKEGGAKRLLTALPAGRAQTLMSKIGERDKGKYDIDFSFVIRRAAVAEIFTIEPEKGTIPPGEAVDITVTFCSVRDVLLKDNKDIRCSISEPATEPLPNVLPHSSLSTPLT